jgi:hypothetical protein
MKAKWYNSTFIVVLRWIFFIPLSLLGGSLASVFLTIILEFTLDRYFDSDSFVLKYLFGFLQGSMSGALFFIIMVNILPKFKKNIVLVIFILFTIINLWILALVYTGEYYQRFNIDISNKEGNIIHIIGSLFFCFSTVYYVFKNGGLKFIDELL